MTPSPSTHEFERPPREVLLTVEDLVVRYPRSHQKLAKTSANITANDAINRVSFAVRRGETFGIAGASGAGKTTLCKTILRLIRPSSGTVYFQTVNLSALNEPSMRVIRQYMQPILQDIPASLDPQMRVTDIVREPLRLFPRTGRAGQLNTTIDLLQLVGLPASIGSRYPDHCSQLERLQIALARALALDPVLLVLDDPLSGLDEADRSQFISLLQNLQEQLELTYLIVAHSPRALRHICDRIGIMDRGTLVEVGDRDEIFCNPQHPHTQALLSAIATPSPTVKHH